MPRGGAQQSLLQGEASAGGSRSGGGALCIPAPATRGGGFLALKPFAAPRPCQWLAGWCQRPSLCSFSAHPPPLSLGSAGGGSRIPISPLRSQLISLTAGGTGKRLSREVGGWGLYTRFEGGNLPAMEGVVLEIGSRIQKVVLGSCPHLAWPA